MSIEYPQLRCWSVAPYSETVAHPDRQFGALPCRHFPCRIRPLSPRRATRLEPAYAAKHRAVRAAEDDVDAIAHADGVHGGARPNEQQVVAPREPAAQEPARTLEPGLARKHARIERSAVAEERHELHGSQCGHAALTDRAANLA